MAKSSSSCMEFLWNGELYTFLIIPRDTLCFFGFYLFIYRRAQFGKGIHCMYYLLYCRGLSTRRDHGLVPGKRRIGQYLFIYG